MSRFEMLINHKINEKPVRERVSSSYIMKSLDSNNFVTIYIHITFPLFDGMGVSSIGASASSREDKTKNVTEV